MTSVKPWYLSRTVWASFVTIATSLAGLFGMSLGALDTSSLTDSILQGVTAVSGFVTIFGRLMASEKLL